MCACACVCISIDQADLCIFMGEFCAYVYVSQSVLDSPKCVCVHVCVCACVYVLTCVGAFACVRVCVCMYMCVRIKCGKLRPCINTHTHTHTHSLTHSRTHKRDRYGSRYYLEGVGEENQMREAASIHQEA